MLVSRTTQLREPSSELLRSRVLPTKYLTFVGTYAISNLLLNSSIEIRRHNTCTTRLLLILGFYLTSIDIRSSPGQHVATKSGDADIPPPAGPRWTGFVCWRPARLPGCVCVCVGRGQPSVLVLEPHSTKVPKAFNGRGNTHCRCPDLVAGLSPASFARAARPPLKSKRQHRLQFLQQTWDEAQAQAQARRQCTVSPPCLHLVLPCLHMGILWGTNGGSLKTAHQWPSGSGNLQRAEGASETSSAPTHPSPAKSTT